MSHSLTNSIIGISYVRWAGGSFFAGHSNFYDCDQVLQDRAVRIDGKVYPVRGCLYLGVNNAIGADQISGFGERLVEICEDDPRFDFAL